MVIVDVGAVDDVVAVGRGHQTGRPGTVVHSALNYFSTMSQIVTEVYDAFRAANVDEALAKAAAGAIAGREDLVTTLDLERAVTGLRTEVKADLSRIEADLKLLKFAYGPLIVGLLIKIAFFP